MPSCKNSASPPAPEHDRNTAIENDLTALSTWMSQAETYLIKGTQLYERICAQSSATEAITPQPRCLTLSFDLFCILIEYTALVDRLHFGKGPTVEELLCSDELLFDTGEHQLTIKVDFFASPDTMVIA